MDCAINVTPELNCPDTAVATVNGEPMCADHLWDLYRDEVEAGHADRIPGIRFL
jgi:hypothetical protein